MHKSNWRSLLEHGGDPLLKRLQDFEMEMFAGICGICHFIVRRIPELAYDLKTWLGVQFEYGVRLAIRISRLLGVCLVLIAVVFGPLAILPWIVAVPWAVVAVAGTLWGWDRHSKKLSLKLSLRREAYRARF